MTTQLRYKITFKEVTKDPHVVTGAFGYPLDEALKMGAVFAEELGVSLECLKVELAR